MLFIVICDFVFVNLLGEFLWANSGNSLTRIGILNGTFQLRLNSNIVGYVQSGDFQIRSNVNQVSTSNDIVELLVCRIF